MSKEIKMDIQNAFEILDRVCAMLKGTREEHKTLSVALTTIQSALRTKESEKEK